MKDSDYKFHILGAFDRFNYGDLLFPYIAQMIIEDKFPSSETKVFATKSSDMRALGALPTESTRAFHAKSNWRASRHVIFVSGGEVLSSPWTHTYEHLLSNRAASWFRRARDLIGSRRMDRVCQFMARSPSYRPWTPNPKDFVRPGTRVQTIYNSVGGQFVHASGDKVSLWQKESLANASWLSVRDHVSAKNIENLGLPKPRTSPDSAVLMQELVSRQGIDLTAEWKRAISRMPQSAVEAGKYILVQCGTRRLQGQRAELCEKLKDIHEASGLPVFGLAIGRAAGHEDDLVAEELKARLGSPDWFQTLPSDLSVWEIMALIANADCYIGSSLHGYITAFAFGVPRIGIGNIGKVASFHEAWDFPDAPGNADIADLPKAFHKSHAKGRKESIELSRKVAHHYRRDVADMWGALT